MQVSATSIIPYDEKLSTMKTNVTIQYPHSNDNNRHHGKHHSLSRQAVL